MKRKIKIIENIQYIVRGIKIINQISPKTMPIRYLGAAINAVSPYVPLYFSAGIINELTYGENLNKILIYVCLTLCLTFVLSTTSNYLSRKENVYYSKLRTGLEIYVSEKSQKIDFEVVESVELSKLREKIIEVSDFGGGLYRIPIDIKNIISSILSMVVAIITFFKMFEIHNNDSINSTLYRFVNSPIASVILILLLGMLSVITVYYKKKYMDKLFERLDEEAEIKSLSNFYRKQYFEDNKAAKDIRIFNEKQLILNEIEHECTKRMWDNFNISLDSLYASKKVQQIISAISGALIYVFVGIKTISGTITLGNLTKYYGAISNFVLAVENLCVAWQYIKNNNRYLEYLFEFLDAECKDDIGSIQIDSSLPQYDIEFHNVTYTYKDNSTPAIKDFSFKFSSGEHIAIVGKNGSGKTTLIKLLCRLYEPKSGYITLNGIDIREYRYEEYLKLFSVVFQDFKLLAFPIGQNIAASEEYDGKKVWESLSQTGMYNTVEEFPKKLDQSIYRQFEEDGIDLSRGEEQKTATARAFYKESPIMILDEPTAALDPISESEMYNRLHSIAKEKTMIYISHRLSSCRFCNRIIVLDKGALIQEGNHENLIEQNGLYRELWNAQAKYYDN